MGTSFCKIDSIRFDRTKSNVKGNPKCWVTLTWILQTLHKYCKELLKKLQSYILLKKIKPLFLILFGVHYHSKSVLPKIISLRTDPAEFWGLIGLRETPLKKKKTWDVTYNLWEKNVFHKHLRRLGATN